MKYTTANAVYDLLELYGADPTQRNSFVYYHINLSPGEHSEWRFCGVLGFGGKFRIRKGLFTNDCPDKIFFVSCYYEDETPERIKAMADMNEAPQKIEQEMERCE